MAFVNPKEHKQYEPLDFPGTSIDYNICWLSSKVEDTQRTHGRIQIRTITADPDSSGPSLDKRSSSVARVGYLRPPRIMCIAKVTWSLCEARFSCAYNPTNGLFDSFLLEHMNGYMKSPQGTPWAVTLCHTEIDGDKTALMLEVVRESTSIGHDVLYLLATRVAQRMCQNLAEKSQAQPVIESSSHEEVANRAESSKLQASCNVAGSVSIESIREADEAKRAQNEKHCSLEEQESASTSQLRLSAPRLDARSQTKDGKPMQSMFGKMGWRWVNWRPG